MLSNFVDGDIKLRPKTSSMQGDALFAAMDTVRDAIASVRDGDDP